MWAPQFNTRFLLAMTGGVAIVAWVGNMAVRDATWAQTLVFVVGVLGFLLLQLGVLFLLAVLVTGGWKVLLRESNPVQTVPPDDLTPPSQHEAVS